MSVKQNAYSTPGQPTMFLYPNQPAVTIHKPNYTSDGIQYLQVGIDEWMEARRNLNEAAFTVYLYLCSNMDGLQKALSPTDICTRTGISNKSYYNAKKELVNKGYMNEQKKDGKTLFYDCFNFYTNPKMNPEFNNGNNDNQAM